MQILQKQVLVKSDPGQPCTVEADEAWFHMHFYFPGSSGATNLYQDGIAIELVSTVLGHARTDTTKSYYAKPSVEQLRDAMESVPTPVSDEAPMWEDNEDEMARLCGLR